MHHFSSAGKVIPIAWMVSVSQGLREDRLAGLLTSGQRESNADKLK